MKISAQGKKEVFKETQNNFDNGGDISIEILRIYEDKKTVIAEMHIVVKDSEDIYVTDIATFNEYGLIECIRAYIARED